jgi:hypothetical protein
MMYPDGISTDVVNLSVSDGGFPEPSYRDFVVEVITINDPPELTAIHQLNLIEDIPFELDLSQYITDVDTPFSNITLEDNSSYSEIEGFIINFTYPDGVSSDLVNLSVYDGENTEYFGITVRISPVNDAPVIDKIPAVEVEPNVPFILSLEEYISDIDNHKQDLIITVDSPYITVEGYVLNITYTKGFSEDEVVVKVSDGLLSDDTILVIRILSSGNGDNEDGGSITLLAVSGSLGAVILVVIIAVIVIKQTKKRSNDNADNKSDAVGSNKNDGGEPKGGDEVKDQEI